ncbi:Xaa-Pro dipeptidase [Vagococcus penaei]|uniref:Xaa-Pro dipeptidase n=1 Tax=Vagococcus penaei TaxID=633807 RepID=A0A1Q2D3M3_9ENTE|nr:Xaa-Pro peptidase family protein [Vagococcus penaei]AQP52984.1 Xaa-Pro dipeptidase [Vagococcus penaei]RSU02556.1 Xaa-Pro dipeptidase [Vagococcus penaei]
MAIEELYQVLKENHLDACLIVKKANVRYISGYHGEDAYLLILPSKHYLFTDARYIEQANQETRGFEIINWRTPGRTLGDSIKEIIEKEQLKVIGFEDTSVTVAMFNDLIKKITCELVPLDQKVDSLRVIKRPDGIANLRAACDIACRAFNRILEDIQVGMTEKEIAAKLAAYMVFEGADTQPYGNIVISGPNTSLLHGIPSNRAIQYGDFVLLDFGCQFNGYLSDMTRTVVVGQANEQQREVYELEKEMVRLSEEAMRAGIPVTDIYQQSINPIKGTPYFDYHYWNIGHAIGLELHELPHIRADSKAVLKENQVLTIEPGIYIPNWGGVRIEDQVVITADGIDNMIYLSHDLIEL